jgi:glycosyltransferase involved in cell wall biosynthesis
VQSNGESCLRGFRGPVSGYSELLPPAERSLCLPRDLRAVGRDLPPPGGADTGLRYQRIEVLSVTESMGRIEDLLRALACRLTDGGTLLIDCENAQSLRALRLAAEGRHGPFDPTDSFEDPSRALSLSRLLTAVDAADLHVVDVVAVPSPAQELRPTFGATLAAEGLFAPGWLHGEPPSRHWLVARRQPRLTGSVLLRVGDPVGAAATETALRAFLPADWEILHCDDASECVAWNRGVARARGEFVWFLRGGADVDATLFARLLAAADVAPAAPGRDGERSFGGDVSGLLLSRLEVLRTGPIAERQDNTPVALEEWNLMLGLVAREIQAIDGRFATPPPPIESPATFAADVAALLRRWSRVTVQTSSTPGTGRAFAPAVQLGDLPPVRPWQDREPRISLCMIARNEERFLPECLQRAQGAFDELILVDTGSTDRTVVIAESFGAKVLHRPWDDDFSAPRNAGLQLATGDWVLVLDADEFLTDGAVAKIRQLARSETVCGWHLHFTNIFSGGKTLGVMMVRLFRNLPGIQYENIIHEQISPTLVRIGAKQGLSVECSGVEVEHHGYLDEVMDGRGKNERNERLFKKQLARNPDDVYSLYKYGDFLRRVPGRNREARDLLEQCFERILAGPPELPRTLPFAGEVAALCALEYARDDQDARAREIVDLALRRFVPTPNLHYIAAGLCQSAGHDDEAITHYRRCLGYRGQILVVPIQEGITSYVSLAGIAQSLARKGDIARARRLLEQSIELRPDYELGHLVLSRLHLQRGEPLAALHTLTTFLAAHPDAVGACQQTTLLLQRFGMQDQARRMGSHALRLLEERAEVHGADQMRRLLTTIKVATQPERERERR